ncbi:hypothetical protein PI95_020720 [Hassallia byssoidea VB512170]|uniref:Uncharacterized protein n=2 Tax=Hassallia TaxID=482629 RepID=A0A846HBZ7_9CYAN|nr:hypothetical protein [Hassalia byssoidea]NEU74912.1 hypothetical protein [Hassalia byssoidea VB512170]
MRRLVTYIIIFLLSLSFITLWMPLNDTACNAEPFLTSKRQKFQVYASKVIVEPWLGEHHVYAIFMVPDKYKESPFFILTVKHVGSFCEKPFGNSQYYDDILAEPGTHLIRDYIRTRLALRLIFQGKYFQLHDKYNWSLTYPADNSAKVNN